MTPENMAQESQQLFLFVNRETCKPMWRLSYQMVMAFEELAVPYGGQTASRPLARTGGTWQW